MLQPVSIAAVALLAPRMSRLRDVRKSYDREFKPRHGSAVVSLGKHRRRFLLDCWLVVAMRGAGGTRNHKIGLNRSCSGITDKVSVPKDVTINLTKVENILI